MQNGNEWGYTPGVLAKSGEVIERMRDELPCTAKERAARAPLAEIARGKEERM